MPELPEVEVLVRHLAPLLQGQIIRAVTVCREKIIAPASAKEFGRVLRGAKFNTVTRRGKFLLFAMETSVPRRTFLLVGHLGMTGRMFLQAPHQPLPKHTAAVFTLDESRLVFEDTRYFGRLTVDPSALDRLGPEPLGKGFTPSAFALALQRSAQAIKVKLLDQSLVAGIGNIYASEALFRAGLSPRLAARRLNREQIRRLWRAVRAVLREAIYFGSTVSLDWPGQKRGDGFFYYGRAAEAADFYAERLRVYDRAGQPCWRCGALIHRCVQAARSTFFCPYCQRQRRSGNGPGKEIDGRSGRR